MQSFYIRRINRRNINYLDSDLTASRSNGTTRCHVPLALQTTPGEETGSSSRNSGRAETNWTSWNTHPIKPFSAPGYRKPYVNVLGAKKNRGGPFGRNSFYSNNQPYPPSSTTVTNSISQASAPTATPARSAPSESAE